MLFERRFRRKTLERMGEDYQDISRWLEEFVIVDPHSITIANECVTVESKNKEVLRIEKENALYGISVEGKKIAYSSSIKEAFLIQWVYFIDPENFENNLLRL